MVGGGGGQDHATGSALVGDLVDDQNTVPAEALVEREQPGAHGLIQPANGFAMVLWVAGWRGRGLGGVTHLRHVEGHTNFFLLSPASTQLGNPFHRQT